MATSSPHKALAGKQSLVFGMNPWATVLQQQNVQEPPASDEEAILEIIDSSPEGKILLSILPRTFESIHGVALDYQRHRHDKLISYLKTMPSLTFEGFGVAIYVTRAQSNTGNGKTTTKGGSHAEVENMILQVVDASHNKRVLLSVLPRVFENRFGVSLDFKKNGHEKLISYLCTFHSLSIQGEGGTVNISRAKQYSPRKSQSPSHVTKNNNDETPSSRSVSRASHPTSSATQKQNNYENLILQIVDSRSDHRVLLSELPRVFELEFGFQLDFRRLGYDKLVSYLGSLPRLSVQGQGGTMNISRKTLGTGWGTATSQPPVPILKPIPFRQTADRERLECEHKVCAVIDQSPSGFVALNELPKQFKVLHGTSLDYAKLGYSQLSTFLRTMRGLTVTGEGIFAKVSRADTNISDQTNTIGAKEYEERILDLLDNRSKTGKLLLAEIPREYFAVYGTQLDYKRLGFDRLITFLRTLPSLSFIGRGVSIQVSKAHTNDTIDISEIPGLSFSVPPSSEYLKDDDQTTSNGTTKIPSAHDSDSGRTDDRNTTTSENSTYTKLDANKTEMVFVDTTEQLENVTGNAPFNATLVEDPTVVSMSCERSMEEIYVLQVGTSLHTFVFDCIKLEIHDVCKALKPMLGNPKVTKVFHSLHQDAYVLSKLGNVTEFQGTFDTQLAVEACTGNMFAGYNQMLACFQHFQKHPLKNKSLGTKESKDIFVERPLSPETLWYVCLSATLLLDVYEKIEKELGSKIPMVQKASDLRADFAINGHNGKRIGFNSNDSYDVASYELIYHDDKANLVPPQPWKSVGDTKDLIDLLDHDVTEGLNKLGDVSNISQIVLDVGKPVVAWLEGKRHFPCGEDRIVLSSEISSLVEKLGGFETVNRAGLSGELHRVVAVRNMQNDIIGLSLQPRKHVEGCAAMLIDFLLNKRSKSILVLGPPKSGKTTLLRDISRILAENENVCIVDTNNEIAGDNDVPHASVGHARRFMVPPGSKQSDVMIDCVRNHMPSVMVVDDISDPQDVESAGKCKKHGSRLIASCEGSLRDLVVDSRLKQLVKAVVTNDSSTISTELVRGGLPSPKLKEDKPTFDVIVQLDSDDYTVHYVCANSTTTMSFLLAGKQYWVQQRKCDPKSGSICLDMKTL